MEALVTRLLNWLWDRTLAEGAVIRGAPGAFVLSVVLVSALAGYILFWLVEAHYGERLRIQASTIEYYKARGVSPAEQRHIQPDERRKLVENLEPIVKDFPTIVVFSDSERSTIWYAREFIDLMKTLNLKTLGPLIVTSEPNETGVMVGLADASKPSDNAKKFASALRRSGLEARHVQWGRPPDDPASPRPDDVDFNLYIGPLPNR